MDLSPFHPIGAPAGVRDMTATEQLELLQLFDAVWVAAPNVQMRPRPAVPANAGHGQAITSSGHRR
jgi:hypothetical protein